MTNEFISIIDFLPFLSKEINKDINNIHTKDNEYIYNKNIICKIKYDYENDSLTVWVMDRNLDVKNSIIYNFDFMTENLRIVYNERNKNSLVFIKKLVKLFMKFYKNLKINQISSIDFCKKYNIKY